MSRFSVLTSHLTATTATIVSIAVLYLLSLYVIVRIAQGTVRDVPTPVPPKRAAETSLITRKPFVVPKWVSAKPLRHSFTSGFSCSCPTCLVWREQLKDEMIALRSANPTLIDGTDITEVWNRAGLPVRKECSLD